MDEAVRTLHAPGDFLCGRYHTRMSVSACVERQKKSASHAGKIYASTRGIEPGMGCVKCKQGERNMKGLENRRVEERKSGRVDGTGKEVMPLCKCGQEAALPHNARVPKWCSKCWGERQRKPRGKYKKRAGRETEETTNSFLDKLGEKHRGKIKPTVEPVVEKERIISVDLSGYPGLLEAIEKTAHEEVRTTEEQIIYTLKQWKRVFVDKEYGASSQ
jgi:hypothetical protein